MPREIQATPADFQELFRRNPVAAANIETIIMERMLSEAEAQRDALQAKHESEPAPE